MTEEEKGGLRVVTAPAIERQIVVVRGQQVLLDEHLSQLYDVETRVLVQQVKRNKKRFPLDFMFQLSAEEFAHLKSRSVMSSGQHGGRRSRPLVFTEQGIAMLSGVLRSDRAIAVNIEIMRAFVELRRIAASYTAIQEQLETLERKTTDRIGQHDEQLEQIFQILHQLITPTKRPRRPVGFRIREE